MVRRTSPPLKVAGFTSMNNDLKYPNAELNSASSLQQDIDVLQATALQILDDGSSGECDGDNRVTGSDCTVLMHSYGAIPTTEALRGLSRDERGAQATAVVKTV